MDGFDDLLTPSRRTLEANPFEDPFGKRSGSPDPWATPFSPGQVQDDHQPFASIDDDAHHQPFGSSSIQDEDFQHQSFVTSTSGFSQYNEPLSPEDEHKPESSIHTSTNTRSSSELTTPSSADPLDSLSANKDEEEQEGRSRKSSPFKNAGFLQDIPAEFSETQTIRPAHLDEDEVAEEHLPPVTEIPTKVALPSQNLARSISEARSRQASPTIPSATSSFLRTQTYSPLDREPRLDNLLGDPTFGEEPYGGGFGGGLAWKPAPVEKDDDSDDDKPIGQTLAARSPPKSPTRAKDLKDENVFVITVDDPQKVGDPMRPFTMYTVHTRTTSTAFQKSAFSVLRRYSDFLWLYETLSLNNPGVIVPPVPEKNPFGRFSDHFVRQRRFALEKCIQKIANHPVLNKDEDFKLFLEHDNFALEIKHRGTNKGGIMASIGQTITGPRFYETDEWFDRQKVYLDSLESQLRGLVKAIDFVAKQRLELSQAIGEFSTSLSDLSSSDVGKGLATSLAGLAEVETKAQEISETQSQQDMITIMSTVEEYARLINSVRLAFSSRIRTYHAWRSADADVSRVKQSHEKYRAQGRIPQDRTGHSMAQIAEVERRALDAKHEFDNSSKLIKSEMARFEQERIDDFKDSLHAFLEGMISGQKELIGKWEEYQQSLLKRAGRPQQQQQSSQFQNDEHPTSPVASTSSS